MFVGSTKGPDGTKLEVEETAEEELEVIEEEIEVTEEELDVIEEEPDVTELEDDLGFNTRIRDFVISTVVSLFTSNP